MTIDEFVEDIEKYYGSYDNAYVKGSVKSYILKDHKPDTYRAINRSIKYFHEKRHGAPCIAGIEKALKSARLEKGVTDTHKVKATNPQKYNYKKEAEENPEEYKEIGSLMTDFKTKIKKV